MITETSFGSWLRSRRRLLDLTQQALADQAGCARITVRRIESGALKPSRELALILLEKLAIPELERPQWTLFARGLAGMPTKPDGSFANRQLTNLPSFLTSFIGRKKEQAEIIELIGQHRLVTLTGSGGVGKTRLAVKVGEQLLADYGNGVWLAELASLSDPELLPQTVASIFGLAAQSNIPFTEILVNFLRTKTLLLVLDNCEHILNACAGLADSLLKNCPKLKIITTSREALGIMGEVAYRVPSLQLLDGQQAIEKIREFESMRLFEERGQLVQADFKLTLENVASVAQICNRLDGIPLAIELAAGRVNIFSPEQIATQLNECFRILTGGSRTALPRQQTIRASMDWSWNLLTSSERILLQRLSVFAGGWTLDAAESVCNGDETEANRVSEGLIQLVEKSLVIVDQESGSAGRYHLLETIRQYAHEKLTEAGEGMAVRDRHLEYFLGLAERAEPELTGPGLEPWLKRLDDELDNIRAALEWSPGSGRVEKGLRLGAALAWFWERRGYWSEGRERMESLLDQPETKARTLMRAKGLFASSVLTSSLGMAWVGGSNASRPYLEEAIAIAREHGQAGKRLYALALTFLSNNLHADNPDLAQSKYEEAWAIAQELGDQWIVALLVHQRGHWFGGQENYTAARDAFEESMRLFRSVGDKRWAAILFSDIGEICFIQGDLAGARLRLEQNLPYFRDTNDRQHICFTLIRLGDISRAEDSFDLAKRFYEEGLEIARDLGGKMQIATASVTLGFVAVHDGELDSAKSLFVESIARARELDSKTMVASALLGFASAAVAEKKAQRTVHLLAVVDGLFELGDKGSLEPMDDAEYQRNLAIARQQLDKATFKDAWEQGQKMTLEQAIDFAMKDE